METRREGGLLAWQWSIYGEGHRDRRTLLVHALTVPAFMFGNCAVALAPLASALLAVGGTVAMTAAMALQGWTHRREATPPPPFMGPLDVVGRIFAEQWITFPRFVLSGGLVNAWRRQGTEPPAHTDCQPDRIAIRFEYEWHDDADQWYRSYGNEMWEFDDQGLMPRRYASINDAPIRESERHLFAPRAMTAGLEVS